MTGEECNYPGPAPGSQILNKHGPEPGADQTRHLRHLATNMHGHQTQEAVNNQGLYFKIIRLLVKLGFNKIRRVIKCDTNSLVI